ncbi:unnamed protein product, partial [Staurois parvus]
MPGDKRWSLEKGRNRKERIKRSFYTMQRTNPLGFTEYNRHALLYIKTEFTVVGL